MGEVSYSFAFLNHQKASLKLFPDQKDMKQGLLSIERTERDTGNKKSLRLDNLESGLVERLRLEMVYIKYLQDIGT